MSNLAEPGFWIIATIPVFGLLQLLGAFLAQPHYRRLNQIAEEVIGNSKSNAADRGYLRSQLSDATVRWPVWLMAIAAPMIGVVGLMAAVAVLRDSSDDSQKEFDDLERRAAKLEGYPDPSEGFYWQSSLRDEMRDAAFNAQILRSPIVSAWIGAWLLPALALLLVGGAATEAGAFLQRILEGWTLRARSRTLRV